MSEPAGPGAFRADLEGLRGLAILLVLGFHAAVPGFSGGFVGVDIFFVLSGFLITGLLLRERERSSTISLRDFYARRARRILPAAAVVLVITLSVAVAVLPPLTLPGYAADAAAAALSVSNYRFATQAMDYFSSVAPPSPFLHYWSLSVEEQFYLLWPLLLLLLVRTSRPRVAAGVALALLCVASAVAAIALTRDAAPWAFYSLPTRAWQLALGGVLAAVAVTSLGRLASAGLAIMGWVGLVAVLVACLVIDRTTPYPGMAALLPAGGAALLIAGGQRKGSPGALLAVPPMRFLGRISYSLYLVHWPILVIPAASLVIGQELPLVERLGLCALAIALGWASWRYVEEPFHRGRRIRLRPGRVIALGSSAIAAVAVFAIVVGAMATAQLDAPGDGPVASRPPGGIGAVGGPSLRPVAVPSAAAPTRRPDGGTAGPRGTPAPSGGATGAAPTPGQAATPEPAVTPQPLPLPVADTGALPRDVQPRLSAAASDWERLFKDGCELQYNGSAPPRCRYGDPNGTRTVALVGDSTAGQWFPALEAIASARHWRIVTYIKFACRFMDIGQFSRILQREYTECEAWLPNVVAELRALQPDLTIVSADRSPGVLNPADDNPVRQGPAMARLFDGVPGQVAVMVTTPQLGFDPPTCLSTHRADIQSCQGSRADAVSWRYLLQERAAARALGKRATVVNMIDWLCPGTTCYSVMNGMIVWRDYFHMTATYAASLAPILDAKLPPLAP